jgi:Rrf2 family transcriptional regulator, nitric oxide-sensitive transcriptional repressor
MFSRKVEYALRAMVHLAAEAPAARTVEQVAAATKGSPTFLAKIIQELVHAGLLRSQRGVGGGISLARAPAELTILEVVDAVDPIVRIDHCPLDLAAHGTNLCPLHRRMDQALATVQEAFRSTTLAEILAEPTTSVPLCDFPVIRVDPPALKADP